MLRRLVLCALALCAFAALEGCGVSRVTGPQLDTNSDRARPTLSARKYGTDGSPPRDDDGGRGTGQVNTAFGAGGIEADSLAVAGSDGN